MTKPLSICPRVNQSNVRIWRSGNTLAVIKVTRDRQVQCLFCSIPTEICSGFSFCARYTVTDVDRCWKNSPCRFWKKGALIIYSNKTGQRAFAFSCCSTGGTSWIKSFHRWIGRGSHMTWH
jgi:hypothetical protein